jgi:3-deoxy-D-manno-octulosonic-acid transferase
LWKRKRDGKEDVNRFDERLGVPSVPRTSGKLVWFHCASVGESASVLPLIDEMLHGNAWIQIMVTTGTITSADFMERRLPARAFHQYVPIDKPEYVGEFIDYWQPDLAIWVESEFWPNLLFATKEWGCPMVLLNARMSEGSYEKWSKYRSTARDILRCFDLILPQSREDARKLQNLGAKRVKYLGNLKYGAPALPYDTHELERLQKMIGKRFVWVAASTHQGEEEEIIRAHLKLKERMYSVLTIIVPRHPHRAQEIRTLLPRHLNVSTRSLNERIAEDTDIYIADSIGELGIFYRLAPIVYIGGSLIEHGGHNPIEAAHLDSAIITGPYMFNFAEIMLEFEKAVAVGIVSNADELAAAVYELWSNPQKRTAMARMAKKHVEKRSEILPNIIEEIETYL